MKFNIMHILSFFLSIVLLISCSSHGQDVIRKSTALNQYQNRVFFGVVDSTLTKKYPFILKKIIISFLLKIAIILRNYFTIFSKWLEIKIEN